MEVEDGKVHLAILLVDAGAPADDLLELGHAGDIGIQHDDLAGLGIHLFIVIDVGNLRRLVHVAFVMSEGHLCVMCAAGVAFGQDKAAHSWASLVTLRKPRN